jgi:hypothetical protein
MGKLVVPSDINHDRSRVKFSGGDHPRGKLFPGDQTGIKADDANESKGHELGAAQHVLPGGERAAQAKGYTVLSPSPVSGAEEYGKLTRGPREYVGIDIDEDLDGDYTGGTDNRRETSRNDRD